MKAKLETLKNGIGNGLKFSPNCDLYEEVSFDDCDFTEPENLQPESVWLLSGFSPEQTSHNDGDPSGWIFTIKNTWMCPPIEMMNPHLFPLSNLVKPMRFEGFNAGEEFIFTELWEVGDDDCFMSVDFGNGNARLISDLETIAKRNIHHDIKYLPSVVVKLMEFLKFNTEDLPPSDFIDASISKVYDPK